MGLPARLEQPGSQRAARSRFVRSIYQVGGVGRGEHGRALSHALLGQAVMDAVGRQQAEGRCADGRGLSHIFDLNHHPRLLRGDPRGNCVAAFDGELHLASPRGLSLYLTVMDSAGYLRTLEG